MFRVFRMGTVPVTALTRFGRGPWMVTPATPDENGRFPPLRRYPSRAKAAAAAAVFGDPQHRSIWP